MRLLSAYEKQLCRRILSNSSKYNVLQNLIDDDLADMLVRVTRDPKQIEVLFSSDLGHDRPLDLTLIDKVLQVLVTSVNLIEMLANEHYIILVQRGQQEDEYSFGPGVIDPSYNGQLTTRIDDENVAELVYRYCLRQIVVTEELKRFVSRGFISRDEQRFSTQRAIAGTALLLSILVGGLNVLNTCSRKPDTRIQQTQIDTIVFSINKVSSTLDSSNVSIRALTDSLQKWRNAANSGANPLVNKSSPTRR